ncbi:MAG: hypothetical protein CO167_06410, partial [Candidatus Marinimicrobia bacterium CG_4_9_14_3_um_filter_48_9]
LSLTWWPITTVQGKLRKYARAGEPFQAWDSNREWGVVKERLPLLRQVWSGKMTLVGAPLDLTLDKQIVKPGLVSMEDIRSANHLDESERIKLLNYYLHNQSFLFDLEILLKAISGH